MSFSDQIKQPGAVKVGSAGPAGPTGSAGPAGATGAAGAAGVVPDAGTTSLSTAHYTATLASRPEPLTSGYAFLVKFNATNPASADIALSSGTAQPLYSNGAALPAGAIVAGCPYLCRSNGTQVEVLGVVPSTLGATNFSSITAPFAARTASTAFVVCAIVSGREYVIEVMAKGGPGLIVGVNYVGTITLYNRFEGSTYPAAYALTSTPTADQVGVYISGANLCMKPGSNITDMISANFVREGV